MITVKLNNFEYEFLFGVLSNITEPTEAKYSAAKTIEKITELVKAGVTKDEEGKDQQPKDISLSFELYELGNLCAGFISFIGSVEVKAVDVLRIQSLAKVLRFGSKIAKHIEEKIKTVEDFVIDAVEDFILDDEETKNDTDK